MSSFIQGVEFAKIPLSMASEQLHLVGPFNFPQHITGRIGEAFGLKGLDAIPSELLVKFRLLSPDTLLWRYLASIELADSLTDSEPHELEELPLSRLLSWERGKGIRTKLRGDIILGPWLEDPESRGLDDKVLNEGTGMTLVLVNPRGSESLRAIYAHSRGPFSERGNIPSKDTGHAVTSHPYYDLMVEHKYWVEDKAPFRVSQPRENPFKSVSMTSPYMMEEWLSKRVYVSSVVADEIVAVEVFNKPTDKGPRFQGAVFYFNDGAAQAVGQCRVGIDSCEVFHEPMWIQCKQTAKPEGSGDDEEEGYPDFSSDHPRLSRIGFSSQTDMDDAITSGWTEAHYLNSVELHFWFTASEVVLTVNEFPLQGRKSYFGVDGSSDGSCDDDVDEDDENEDDQDYDDGDDEPCIMTS
ncbi:hypothetical protein DL765_011379 [Monosporascus sp. GIB2]|nr:hypothetical protein DL765_011379 [Monosporascus sp. GIB2]